MKRSIAGIVERNGSFLVGLRLPTGEMGGRWEFPGGKVDQGEKPEESLIREFREEMGVDVVPGRVIAKVTFENRNGPVELTAYEVTMLEETPTYLTEHEKFDWITLHEVERRSFVDSDLLLVPYIRNWYEKQTR